MTKNLRLFLFFLLYFFIYVVSMYFTTVFIDIGASLINAKDSFLNLLGAVLFGLGIISGVVCSFTYIIYLCSIVSIFFKEIPNA